MTQFNERQRAELRDAAECPACGYIKWRYIKWPACGFIKCRACGYTQFGPPTHAEKASK